MKRLITALETIARELMLIRTEMETARRLQEQVMERARSEAAQAPERIMQILGAAMNTLHVGKQIIPGGGRHGD